MKQKLIEQKKSLIIGWVKQAGHRAVTWVDWIIHGISLWIMTSICSLNAYAGGIDIDTDISVGNLDTFNAEGVIIGIAIWVCRLIGIAMLIWGIYGFVTARKDGEAESMTAAISKLLAGIVLISIKGILGGLNIIA